MNKQEVRDIFKKKRKVLTSSQVDELSLKIFENLKNEIKPGSLIHVFLPIRQNNEVNTWLLIQRPDSNSSKFVISRTDFENHTMEHFIYSPDIKTAENKMGIPEPTDGEKADINAIDVVLIPLLAYDEKGNRIGYGKGYYDEFLGILEADVKKIGLSFFPPTTEQIDVDSHDVEIDMCITPERTYRFN